MKKGSVYLSLVLLTAAVILSTILATTTIAVDCLDGWTDYECVCGYKPNSTTGYGQVIIGSNYFSCNNIPDGVCPQDFIDPSGLVGNCSSCIDPDCKISVSGTVRDDSSRPVSGAIVTAYPTVFNPGVNLRVNTTTNFNGQYSFNVPTGEYPIGASKDGYDTHIVDVVFPSSLNSAIVDFTLVNGTCHDDCTDSYNRCNSLCDGVSFNDSNTRCQFYNDEVKNVCHNRLKGSVVYLGPSVTDPDNGQFVECCAEPLPNPEYPSNPAADPFISPIFEKFYATATISCDANNIIRVEKIARYNNVPVRVIISYWD
jgi:hypothetical protein